MASFRFLHAADIHLDSPLKGLTGQDGSAAERVRTATRESFDRLVGMAIEEKVSFLVIAGDLYDGDWRDYKTGLFFAAQMGRLNAANIPAYLLHGNHDAESQITKRLDLPGNVHVFGTRSPETFRLNELNVALHGQSFRQRAVTDNLVPDYPAPVNGAFNIGVLHTACGMGGHENYAPCSLDDLVNKGYDYWALGHVHQAAVLHERPHVVFPGNLQGRHVKETGAKGACLVTVRDNEIIELEAMPCDVVRWAVLRVSLAGASGMGDVIDRVRQTLETAVANDSNGRLLACRIVLEGRTEVHARLIASEEQLLADARASALGLGEEVAWVEKVTTATQATLDPQALAQREDAIGELQRMLQDAKSDRELLAQIEGDIGELVRRLPHEVRTDIDDDLLKSAIAGDYDALIKDVGPYLSARLLAGEA
jgi:DNA repair exonuclease SbcCD nuclease subunit